MGWFPFSQKLRKLRQKNLSFVNKGAITLSLFSMFRYKIGTIQSFCCRKPFFEKNIEILIII